MNCKFCNAELEAENTVCPACGKDNAEAVPEELEQLNPEKAAQETIEIPDTVEMPQLDVEKEETAEQEESKAQPEEPAPKPKKKWKLPAVIAACVVLVLAAAAAVWYCVNDGWKPRENDIKYKTSYTASAEELLRNADTVVATLGNKELTNAELQVYYWTDFYDFLNYYGSYAIYYGMDYTQPLDEQVVSEEEGLTWQHYFLDHGLNDWHQYASLNQEAEAAGFQINEELRAKLDAMPEQMEEMAVSSGFETAEQMLQTEIPGATIDAYMNYLYTYYTAGEYFNSILEERAPTDAQIDAYYAENEEMFVSSGIGKDAVLVDVRHILLYPEGGTVDESGNTTYSDDEWAACEAAAQDILNQWQAGEATENSFAELANTYSQDPGSNTNGGLYAGVYAGQMVEAFNDWCFDENRQSGDTGLVRTEFGYHIMYFVGSAPSNEWYEYAQDQLLTALSNQITEEIMGKYTLEVNYKKILIGAVDFSTQAE